MWKSLKKKCFSLILILKKFGQRLVNPIRRKRSMPIIEAMRVRQFRGELPESGQQCTSEKIPLLATTLKKATSCPLITLTTHAETVSDGIAQVDHLGQESALILRHSRKQGMNTNGKMPQTNGASLDFDGASAKEEKGRDTSEKKDVKRKISTALTITTIGAKAAALGITIASLLASVMNTDVDDDDVIDVDIESEN